ncbi:hypothetical protein BofuT4_P047670.1 [Botrytis cinerea T4]|uniref:Uncharacterized protein n=1 Tax=Botryotinia fuckeliana (strain T4) TaxID=999810 RepID=G2XZ62_BOTF4|nr:hypothetical protein BofuT4_P047670.1 [Botrytis cinerea T4]
MRTEGPSTSPSGECLPIYRAKSMSAAKQTKALDYTAHTLCRTEEYNFTLRWSFDTPCNGWGPIIKAIVGFLNCRDRDQHPGWKLSSVIAMTFEFRYNVNLIRRLRFPPTLRGAQPTI